MPFKVVTAKEWEAMGLPTEISTISFGNTSVAQKIKEHNKKKKEEKSVSKKESKRVT